jgi:hypothetical protein
MLQSITFESNFLTFGGSDFSYFNSPKINTTANSNKFYYTTKIQEPLKYHYDESQGKQVYVANPFTNGIFKTTFKQSFPETIVDNDTVYNIKSLRIYPSIKKSEFHSNSSSSVEKPTTQYYYCADVNSTPLYEFSFADFSNLTFPFSFISFGDAPLSIVLIFEELNST